jgi:hypothetical protein
MAAGIVPRMPTRSGLQPTPGSRVTAEVAASKSARPEEATDEGATFLTRLRLAWIRLEPLAMAVFFAIASRGLVGVYAARPDRLFGDARIYFRATEAWLAGGNPWLTANAGIAFAAPPPALLLNLPLVVFGETAAVVFWVASNAIAVVWLLRRLGLPPWWLLFYPIAEGFTGGSPDLLLAALIVVGGGWLAALIKPYSIPALLSAHRWRAVVAAGAVLLVTIPILPWGTYLASGALTTATSAEWVRPNSAWGVAPLMAVTAVALILLGGERGLALLTPALIGLQPHYAVFSLPAISRSRLATIGIAYPGQGAAAIGVIVYALAERLRPVRRRRRVLVRGGAEPISGTGAPAFGEGRSSVVLNPSDGGATDESGTP